MEAQLSENSENVEAADALARAELRYSSNA